MLSAQKNPCPICGRTTIGCKIEPDHILCRIGNTYNPLKLHPDLKVSDVINGWACTKINLDAECVTFKLHEERERQVLNFRQWRYSTPEGKTATHNRTDYNFGPKDISWSKGTKVDDLLPLWYEDLPESGSTIYLAEGETCAEALKQLGLVATSVPNGSGSWKSNMPDMPKLANNALVLCPDRDRPGIALMERLHKVFPHAKWLLAQATNASAWSESNDGYDISDWMQDGATIEMLLCAIQDVPPVLARQPWRERIGNHQTEKGQLVRMKSLSLATLLSGKLSDALRWNELRQTIEVDGEPMQEIDARLAYVNLQYAGIDVNKEVAQDAFLLASRERPYHPIVEYLDACNEPLEASDWDNVAGVLLGDHAISFDNSALRKWLIQSVARIYEPGCPYGFVHILSGDQHLHKTRFYNTLASEPWFYEGFIKTNKEADDVTGLHMRWICEWGELDGGIKHHESAGLKNFITRKTDLVREAYGKGHRERPRRFSLCGTTNKKDGFFTDETGNRRFVIFDIRKCIDSNKIEKLRNRIWASARHDYLNGCKWFLDDEETTINNLRNRGLYSEDPWHEKISARLAITCPNYVIAADLLTAVLDVPLERQNQQALTRVNRILVSIGWIKTRKEMSGTFKQIWRPPGQSM